MYLREIREDPEGGHTEEERDKALENEKPASTERQPRREVGTPFEFGRTIAILRVRRLRMK